MKVSELAELIGCEIEGGNPNSDILGMSPLDEIKDGSLVFLEKTKDAEMLKRGRPAAIICSKAAKVEAGGAALLRADNPRVAFVRAMRQIYKPEEFEPEIHATAVVEDGAVVAPTAYVGANCFVGAGSMVGDRAIMRPGSHVGRNSTIGEGCLLHPNSTVLDRVELGKRVILHSGSVVGSDGFGYVQDEGVHMKVPQVGKVIIGDDVEIGANSAVDRATLGATVIGRGTKIDNQVQIGHNVKIGEYCLICGSVGISGSCEIGNGVVLAGQVGVSDHVKIGDRAILGGKTGVSDDIPPGVLYSGFPARPHRRTMKIFSALDKLPEIVEKVERMKEEE